jgi:hypothetical protein
MDGQEKDRKDEWPDDDRVIYIPDREYHSFMRSLYKMELAQKELHRIRDSIKPEDSNSKNNQSLE